MLASFEVWAPNAKMVITTMTMAMPMTDKDLEESTKMKIKGGDFTKEPSTYGVTARIPKNALLRTCVWTPFMQCVPSHTILPIRGNLHIKYVY